MGFFKTLTTGVAVTLVFYSQACATEYISCGNKTGDTTSNCWSCGETCSARFDSSSHTITFSGTGDMTPSLAGDSSTAPWKGIVSQIHSIVIEEGITSVPNQTFHNYYQNTGNVTSVYLPSTLTSIGGAAFARMSNGNQLDGLVIPENVTEWGGSVFYHSYGNIYCPVSQINNCNQNNDGGRKVSIASYEHKDGFYYVYDGQGNVDEIYANYGDFNSSVKKPVTDRLSQKDENGNITVYNANGQILGKYLSDKGLTRYVYNDDGSVMIYDKSGKLIGTQGKRIFTVDEATALASGNKNTFSIKYR